MSIFGSLDHEGGSSSLNSEPELDLLLPIELGLPPATDILADDDDEPSDGVAMILSSSSDFTSVVEGGFVDRGRLPLRESLEL
jgi:hypothetical protein